MQGAILCKFEGVITILANGEYTDMDKKFDTFLKITPGKQLRCIEADGLNIAELQLDQSKANIELDKYFN